MQLKINKKNHQIKFGYGAYRRVCEYYGLKKVSGFNDLITRFELDKMEDPSFAQMEFIGNLVVAGVQCADDSAAVNSDDVIDALWVAPELLAKVMEAFAESMPKASPAPKAKGK